MMYYVPAPPDAIKAEVCIANPDATKREGFISWIRREALTPLPEPLIDNIVASWDTHTFRTQLESTLAHHHGEMTQKANLLLNYYQSDTVDHVDSLRWVWQQIRTPAARYAEALTYLQEEDYTAARDVIFDIPEEHDLRDKQEGERWRMLAVIDFLESIHQDGRNTGQLTGVEQTELQTIIAEQHDRAATWAQNILCFHYGKCRAPLSGGDGGTPKARRVVIGVTGPITANLHIYPNPASSYVVFEVELPAEPEGVVLVIQDIAGRELKRLIVTSKEQQLVMDSREYTPGTYCVLLSISGETVQSKNFIIRQ